MAAPTNTLVSIARGITLLALFGLFVGTAFDQESANPEQAPHRADTIEGDDSKPALEVFPGVYASLMIETVYFVECGDRAVLIDTGWDHTFEKHLTRFRKAGLDTDRIDAVFATHSHVDHMAGARRARTTRGFRILAQRNAARVIPQGDRIATAARMPALGWDANDPPATIDFLVDDNDIIDVNGTRFTVHHVPGHTPDSIAYQLGDLLSTGDAFFPNPNEHMLFPGWSDVHWGSNSQDILDSFEKLKVLSPQHCLPSHGMPFAFEAAQVTNGINRLKEGMPLFFGPVNDSYRAPRRSSEDPPRTHTIPRRETNALAEPLPRLAPAFTYSFHNGLGIVRANGPRAGLELVPFGTTPPLSGGYFVRLKDVLQGKPARSSGLVTPLTGLVAEGDGQSVTVRFRRSIRLAPEARVTYVVEDDDVMRVDLDYRAGKDQETDDEVVFLLESLLPSDATVETSGSGKWTRLEAMESVIHGTALRVGRKGSSFLVRLTIDRHYRVSLVRSSDGKLLTLHLAAPAPSQGSTSPKAGAATFHASLRLTPERQ